MTPLMYAVKDNRTALLDRMIELGADVGARNNASIPRKSYIVSPVKRNGESHVGSSLVSLCIPRKTINLSVLKTVADVAVLASE